MFKEINLYGIDYLVSDKGEIINKKTGNTLKQRTDKDGYAICTVGGKNNRQSVKVHRVVATLFIPNPRKYKEINHKDYNRFNPNMSNLEWCSRKDNINYSKIHYQKMGYQQQGENNPNAKLSKIQVLEIRDKLKFKSINSIAEEYRVGWQTINHIKKRNTWKNI